MPDTEVMAQKSWGSTMTNFRSVTGRGRSRTVLRSSYTSIPDNHISLGKWSSKKGRAKKKHGGQR